VVSIVGGDGVSYGSPHPKGPWREVLLAELKGKIDLSRVHFHGKVPYEQHLALLKRSDAHVYLSYPFVASWSLREALACGCVVIGGDTQTVTEFVKHRENGLVVKTLDPKSISKAVLTALEDTKLSAQLRAGARAFAEKHLDMKDYLARYRAVIEDVAGMKLVQPVAAAVKPVKKPARRAVKK
jgi:glycosyltransferase involved in cell wall biosynthesis